MCSVPSTSSFVPDAINQARLHARITRSIHGVVSLMRARTMTEIAPMIVAITPTTQVMIVLGKTRSHFTAATVAMSSPASPPGTGLA